MVVIFEANIYLLTGSTRFLDHAVIIMVFIIIIFCALIFFLDAEKMHRHDYHRAEGFGRTIGSY